jgi:hypothetical protein
VWMQLRLAIAHAGASTQGHGGTLMIATLKNQPPFKTKALTCACRITLTQASLRGS